MDAIIGIYTWIKDNLQTISGIVAYVIAVASIIVKITPTLRDDNVLLGIVKFISKYIALNRTTQDDIIRDNE